MGEWWARFFRTIAEPVSRRGDRLGVASARLLASSIVVITGSFIALDLFLSLRIPGYSPPWPGYFILVTCYVLSRTGFVTVAAVAMSLMFPLVAVATTLFVPHSPLATLAFATVAPVFAGVFLGVRGTLFVSILSPVAVLSLHWTAVAPIPFYELAVVTVACMATGGVTLLYATHRNVQEQERETLAKAQERQLQQMQKMEAVGRLAGGIAHDFNNLLTVIAGGVELLQRKGSSREVELIESAARSAKQLTAQLLTLSRQSVVEPGAVRLGPFLEELRELLGRIIGEDIAVVVEVAPGTRAVALPQGRLQQVLLNLVTNARDAMPRGGRLRILATNYEDGVRIVVEDTGTGMDEATRRRIFEPFFTTKDVGKGTGLGLSMVFGIVTQSGGHVEVESERLRGTAVSLYLPAADGEPPPLARSESKLPVHVGARGTVLLVEDADAVRELCERTLRDAGYVVLAAPGPEEALRLFEADPSRVDLVVSDLVMPVLSGTELVAALHRRNPDLPALFISGYAPDELGVGPLDARLVLAKPFRPQELLARVNQLLWGAPEGGVADAEG